MYIVMKGMIIIHENGDVTIRQSKDGVWLSKYRIADLFGVMTPAITSNIRSILHQGILNEQEVCQYHTTSDGKQIRLYNLYMITALSFRLRSELRLLWYGIFLSIKTQHYLNIV